MWFITSITPPAGESAPCPCSPAAPATGTADRRTSPRTRPRSHPSPAAPRALLSASPSDVSQPSCRESSRPVVPGPARPPAPPRGVRQDGRVRESADLVIPVKMLDRAKTRLLGAADRGAATEPRTRPWCWPWSGTRRRPRRPRRTCARVLVVTSDPTVADALAADGVATTPDVPDLGLNAAYATAPTCCCAPTRGDGRRAAVRPARACAPRNWPSRWPRRRAAGVLRRPPGHRHHAAAGRAGRAAGPPFRSRFGGRARRFGRRRCRHRPTDAALRRGHGRGSRARARSASDRTPRRSWACRAVRPPCDTPLAPRSRRLDPSARLVKSRLIRDNGGRDREREQPRGPNGAADSTARGRQDHRPTASRRTTRGMPSAPPAATDRPAHRSTCPTTGTSTASCPGWTSTPACSHWPRTRPSRCWSARSSSRSSRPTWTSSTWSGSPA